MYHSYQKFKQLHTFYHLTALVCCMSIISSCSKFLDAKPISEVPAENMWQNQRDVKAGISEIYSSFRDAMRANFFEWGELRSDNYVLTTEAASDRGKLIANQMTNDMACTNWSSLYKVISNTNFAIKHIPQATLANTAEKNDYLAQAYAMRALCYFYAVRVWGDVPVYLEPVDNLENGVFKSRTSMREVLENVIMPDLKRAEQLVDPASLERKRISRAGIYAIQADVSMWLEDYDSADKIIDKVRTMQSFTGFQPSMEVMKRTFVTDLNNKTSDNDRLRDEYGPGFNELIFVIHFDLRESVSYSLIYNLFGAGVLLSPKLTNIFAAAANTTPRDIRFDNFLRVGTTAGTYRMNKYVTNGSSISFNALSECEMAYPVYRFTDWYVYN